MQKQNSQRRPNDNNLVIKCGQGALVPSQGPQSSLDGLGVKKKKSACNAEDVGLIPGSGKSPRGGNGNPLQYFLPGEAHG